MSPRRVTAAAVGVVALATAASGCGLSGGVYNLPLPGGADVGSRPLTVSADFRDVLDLVPQSAVKVDNVAVGRVSKITLNPDGRSAHVVMTVNRGARLRSGTSARLQQSSLLGEKYVALVRPGDTTGRLPGQTVPAASTSGGYLRDGARIPLSETSQAVGIEQVLGALSLLLNGGGLGQFQEISRELQAVSAGRPDQIRAFLDKTAVFVRDLDQRKDSITAALDGLARLGTTLNDQQPEIKTALDDLSPGLRVLADQRGELVKMLTALDKLSKVSVDTLDQAQDQIVSSLKDLDPILTQLAKSGSALPQSLEVLFTYPFPDSVLGAIKGDYLNVYLTANLNTPGGPWAQPDSMWPTGTPVSPNTLSAPLVPGGPSSTSSGPPTILPSTSSAAPGVGSPTLPGGTGSTGSTGSGSASPGGPSSSSGSSGTPSQSSSGSGSPSPSQTSSDPSGPASSDGTPSASNSAAVAGQVGGES